MLSEFGKALRKIRIDRQILLKEMADKLGVSSAYLSAVETGKRKIPEGWFEQISKLFKLNEQEKSLLKEAEGDSAMAVKISFEKSTSLQKNTALSFAKVLEGLSESDLEKIMMILNNPKRGGRHRT